MLSIVKSLAILGVIGATVICPLCESRIAAARPIVQSHDAPSATDLATTRLHISGMTCGTCPVTARVALKRIPGVYDATVTLGDSLAVVQYNPDRVTPLQIAAQLTKMTGYPTKVLDSAKPSPRV